MTEKSQLPNNLVPLEIWPRFFSGLWDIIPYIVAFGIIFFILSVCQDVFFPGVIDTDAVQMQFTGLMMVESFSIFQIIYFGIYEAQTGASWGLKKRNGIIIMQTGDRAKLFTLFMRFVTIYPFSLVYTFSVLLEPHKAIAYANFFDAYAWLLWIYYVVDFFYWYRTDCHYHLADILFKTVIVERNIYFNGFSGNQQSIPLLTPSIPPREVRAGGYVQIDPLPEVNRADASKKMTQPSDVKSAVGGASVGILNETLLNKIYTAVNAEIMAKKFDEPLLLRADVESGGDEKSKMRIYTKLRVEKYIASQKK